MGGSHVCEWGDYYREGSDHVEVIDCDTCGRSFLGRGPSRQQAMDDANALHTSHGTMGSAHGRDGIEQLAADLLDYFDGDREAARRAVASVR